PGRSGHGLLVFDLELERRERVLGVLLRPLGLEDADLLARVVDGHVAPCLALRALTRNSPASLPNLCHAGLLTRWLRGCYYARALASVSTMACAKALAACYATSP